MKDNFKDLVMGKLRGSDNAVSGPDMQAGHEAAHASELQLALALEAGVCQDPFGSLGLHPTTCVGHYRLRAYLPGAHTVCLVDKNNHELLARLQAVNDSALFVGDWATPEPAAYLLQVSSDWGTRLIEDPFRFGLWLGDTDVWLLKEGSHLRPWEKLGAHPCTLQGVTGVAFAVWAPNARQVSLAADFNLWNSRCHPMRFRQACGVWELFVPGAQVGALYKFDILGADGQRVLKTDPYALSTELPPGNASRVMALPAPVTGRSSIRRDAHALDAPISIYEVHAGSWRRQGDEVPDWH